LFSAATFAAAFVNLAGFARHRRRRYGCIPVAGEVPR
jgi:hypothetical protein